VTCGATSPAGHAVHLPVIEALPAWTWPRPGHDGWMTQDLPPRATDIFRYLMDLRSGTYEGARQWPERVEAFRRAVSLLDPVVRRVLE